MTSCLLLPRTAQNIVFCWVFRSTLIQTKRKTKTLNDYTTPNDYHRVLLTIPWDFKLLYTCLLMILLHYAGLLLGCSFEIHVLIENRLLSGLSQSCGPHCGPWCCLCCPRWDKRWEATLSRYVKSGLSFRSTYENGFLEKRLDNLGSSDQNLSQVNYLNMKQIVTRTCCPSKSDRCEENLSAIRNCQIVNCRLPAAARTAVITATFVILIINRHASTAYTFPLLSVRRRWGRRRHQVSF